MAGIKLKLGKITTPQDLKAPPPKKAEPPVEQPSLSLTHMQKKMLDMAQGVPQAMLDAAGITRERLIKAATSVGPKKEKKE